MITDWLGCLPLADRGLAVTQNSKTWLAIGLFAAAVLAASIGLLYLPIALGLVVIGYVWPKSSRCKSFIPISNGQLSYCSGQ